jgi:hypothetical protein
VLLEIYARHHADKDVIHYKMERIEAYGDSIETVFIGSSITYWGVDPQYWGDGHSFNLANNCHTIDASYYILDALLPKMKNVKNLFLEVALFSFYDPWLEIDQGGVWKRWIPLTLYYKTKKHSHFSKYGFEISNPEGFRMKVVPWNRLDSVACTQYGHCKTEFRRLRHYEITEQSMRITLSHQEPRNFDCQRHNVDYFERILQLAQQHGLNVYVVIYPMHPLLYKYHKPCIWNRTVNIVNFYQKKYHFAIMDYSHDSRIEDDDFRDNMHLSTDVGSTKWTKILYEDYKTGTWSTTMQRKIEQ